jgi:predicted nucleic acid-binding Zn ribbon protein
MRQIGDAVPGAIASLLRDTPMSPGKMEFAWRTAVGTAFGKVTSVRLDGCVLYVDAATTHWAREVARSSPVILRRLRTLLGENVVTSLNVRSKQQDRPDRPQTMSKHRTKPSA